MQAEPDFASVAEWAALLVEAEMRRIRRDPAYQPYSEEDLLTLAWIAASSGCDAQGMGRKLAGRIKPEPALI